MDIKGYEVYTYFGRVLARFHFNEDELAVQTYERAYIELVEIERGGRTCWIRPY